LWSRLLARTVLARNEALQGPGVVSVRLYPGSAAPDPGRWIREMRGVPRMVWSLSCFLMYHIPVLAAGGRAWPGPEARGG
jgi:hypothetical protein